MKFKLNRRKLFGYSALTAVIAGGLWLYNSDDQAPEISNVNFSRSSITLSSSDLSLAFSGRITDQRGVSLVELRCINDGETELMSYMVMSGSFRGSVSFGFEGSTYNWVSYWDGTRYDLTYDAVGRIPPNSKPLKCNWFANLADELGNQALVDLNQSLEITE